MTQPSFLDLKRLRLPLSDVSIKVKAPKFYVRGYNGAEMVEAILKRRGWIKVGVNTMVGDDFNLGWTELTTQINFLSLKPSLHLVNHIPNNSLLANKLGLLQSLRDHDTYCKRIKKLDQLKMDDFTPKTFIMDDAFERNEFFKTFKEGDIWICKPIGANQGKGISLIRDLNKFKSELADANVMHKNMWSFQPKLTQRYIVNPLLIDGRKFDIRCYMLIASTIPYLVLFCPGYIRLSINKYSNSDDNLITHLTNQFIQKQSPKYHSVKESTIWSIEKFNDYFNETYNNLKNFKEDWVKDDLTNNIKDIIRHVFKSVEHKLANSVSFFELFGLDFMVDDNLKIWLIEANSNPSMSSGCSFLQQLIPPIIEEVLLIALECFEKNTKSSQSLLPLDNMKRFEVIYNEPYDGAVARKSKKPRYKFWTAPRFKTSYYPTADTHETKTMISPILPMPTSFSMFSRLSQNDIWIDRWNKKLSSEKSHLVNAYVSDFPAQIRPRHEPLSEQLSLPFRTLSGDVRQRTKAIDDALHSNSIKISKDSNGLAAGLCQTPKKNTTQNKLKELIRKAQV